MHPQTEYLVVIKPAPIKAPVGVGVGGYTVTSGSGIRTTKLMAEHSVVAMFEIDGRRHSHMWAKWKFDAWPDQADEGKS